MYSSSLRQPPLYGWNIANTEVVDAHIILNKYRLPALVQVKNP